MGKARADTCHHPVKRHATLPSFGHTLCQRCDTDITPESRSFEYKAGERTTFRQGDRVHVKSHDAIASFKGIFQWASEESSGVVLVICEQQTFKDGSRWVEATAAVRHIRPEYVRHDDGVRGRRAREEQT